MHKNSNSKAQGFTLIEVVLVLAIAGLIFLIVFLALPALQRSQRDTQRRNDLARLISQLTQYQSNKQGAIPSGTTWNGAFKTDYLTSGGQSFTDPSGTGYTITEVTPAPGAATAQTVNTGEIKVYPGTRCDGANASGLTTTDAGSRSVAALVKLEQGGNYCQNN